MSELKRTPLYPLYEKWGGKTVNYEGWALPVQFAGVKTEHEAVRTRAGLFDVSHMGEIHVSGKSALPFLQKMLTNDLDKIEIGKAQYTFLCNENGGTIDDLIVYQLGENEYLLVVNAANVEKDYNWLKKHQIEDVTIENVSDQYALLAVQGPLAQSILQKITDTKLSEISFFRFEQNVNLNNKKGLIARTGYTGEDGFEVYCRPDDVCELWEEILSVGKDEGIVPCGLAARDTLRFEAGLPLYGQELSETISPIEAGLKFAVKMDKEDFFGKDVLAEQIANGTSRKLVGIDMIDRGIPRTGYDVRVQNDVIGYITTGTQSPTLKKNIGFALIQSEFSDLGTEVFVSIRNKLVKGKVVSLPFYKRKK